MTLNVTLSILSYLPSATVADPHHDSDSLRQAAGARKTHVNDCMFSNTSGASEAMRLLLRSSVPLALAHAPLRESLPASSLLKTQKGV